MFTIQTRHGDFIGQVIEVTPQLAELWMSQSEYNFRTQASSYVEMYAAQMTAGQWHPNLNPILIDIDNNILDGGHRLSAIIKSGVPIEMLVIRNVSKVFADGLDYLRSRTASQWLADRGAPYPHVAAAVVKSYLLISLRKWGTKAKRLAPTDINHAYGEMKDRVQSTVTVVNKSNKVAPVSTIGGIYLYAAKNLECMPHESHAITLFNDLLRGAVRGPDDSPPVQLAGLLHRNRISTGRAYNHIHVRALAVVAWNHFLNQENKSPRWAPARQDFPDVQVLTTADEAAFRPDQAATA